MSSKRAFGYVPAPKSRAKEVMARSGVVERLDSIAREKAEDNEPLVDALPRLSLAERTALQRSQLGAGLDLDAQIAEAKRVAVCRPNSDGFIQHLMTEFDLSEAAARCYGVALRTVEAVEKRQSIIAVPIGGRDRVHVAVEGHSMIPPAGWANYYPGQISQQAILGLPPSTVLTGPQYGDAARVLENAHEEWEQAGLVSWIQRTSWGLLRV